MDGQPVEAVGTAPVVEVIKQNPVGALIRRHEAERGVDRRGIKSGAADVHGAILNFFHGTDLLLAFLVFRYALNSKEGVGGRSEAFANNLNPVGVALFRVEGHPVTVTSRIKLADIFAGDGNLLRLFRIVVVGGSLGHHRAVGKVNADGVGCPHRAGQAIVDAIKTGGHRPHRRAAGNIQAREGIAGQADGHVLFLQRLAAQCHARVLASGKVATVHRVLAVAAGLANRRDDEIDIRALRNSQSVHVLRATTIGEVIDSNVVVASGRRGEIQRSAKAIALQLQLVSVLEYKYGRHLRIDIRRLTLNKDTLGLLQAHLEVAVVARAGLTVDGGAKLGLHGLVS